MVVSTALFFGKNEYMIPLFEMHFSVKIAKTIMSIM